MEITKNSTVEIYFNESERKKYERTLKKYVSKGATINSPEDYSGSPDYEFCTQLQLVTISLTPK
jgi:hypothetical protein